MNPNIAANGQGGGATPEVHQFSRAYEQRKRALIAEVAKNEQARASTSANARRKLSAQWSVKSRLPALRHAPIRVAAAVAVLCIAMPVAGYAIANHEAIFDGMFGNGTREDHPAQTYAFEKGDGTEHAGIVPVREFADVDPQTAELLLGDALSDTPQTIQAGAHELTVTSVVRSENQMAVAFTLKDDPEHPTFQSDERDYTKGVWFADDATMTFFYSTTGGAVDSSFETSPNSGYLPKGQPGGLSGTHIGHAIYIDPEQSTDTKLYCYDYLVFPEGIPGGEDVMLTAAWYEGTDRESYQTATISLTTPRVVPAKTFASESGAQMQISPIGLTVGCEGQFEDIDNLTVHYKDGSSYRVWGSDGSSEDADVEGTWAKVNNAMYALGVEGEQASSDGRGLWGCAFNRLVDPEAVESVEVAFSQSGTIVFQ